MSELKAFNCVESDLQEFCEPRLVYLKSEADKVIAEKEKKLDIYKRGWMENDKVNANQYAEIRHHKYKRCLAMASKCRLRARWFGDNAYYKKEQRALQWHRRWLAIAEKFKTNSTINRKEATNAL